ncbi:response regulator receiver protein [Geminocystis sp. NIES-3708]|uniref:response regulator n=1 Tax=Geminocystis sp. NIES-3708 TaxID=1615909 RepID=UPI0005FC70E2|nr:response regulator [Geminocystis sp. NIES-3708]BAQ62237.1 response regulator receiver protein [Geminocystis sp. NIES-3708]
MYGDLQEIDVNSLFYFISTQQKTGVFFVETESNFLMKKLFYFIFFERGEIIFAADQQSFDLQRLQEYLTYYQLNQEIQSIEESLIDVNTIAEYEAILLLSEKKIISINQQKNLIKNIIEEVLFNVFFLRKGYFSWQENINLEPLIIRFNVDFLIPKIANYAQNWQQLNPYIRSPQECPFITNNPQLKLLVSDHLYQTLCAKIDGKTSFLQLSRYLHQDLATIGQFIYPYVEMGWIKIITPFLLSSISQYSSPKTFNIFCLTQDKNWAFKTEKILHLKKYNLFTTDSFRQGLNNILTSSVDLIILDSDIDHNEKYQLCKILKNIENKKNIPIIFLVNKYNHLNYLTAKIYGVNEYINKKKFNQNLIKIIEQYL